MDIYIVSILNRIRISLVSNDTKFIKRYRLFNILEWRWYEIIIGYTFNKNCQKKSKRVWNRLNTFTKNIKKISTHF